jgi:hypothetical protein
MSPFWRRCRHKLVSLSLVMGCWLLAGCYSLPRNLDYAGPLQRPLGLEDYYARDQFSGNFTSEIKRETDEYILRRYTVESMYGPFSVDYYQQRGKQTDSIVFVFPVLGGKKNLIENYFAEYFVRHGLDVGIVARNEEFKKPENFDRIEEVMRQNVVRDRMAIDFFESHLGKKQFGTFGISRGAINVAMTAGVDERLKYNVILLGGADLVQLFSNTDQPRVRRFVKTMMEKKNMTEPELYEYLRGKIKTDPKYLARFIDGRNTLLMLALFDQTVPIKTGFDLRRELGEPETIVFMAGHYSSILFTSIADQFLPTGKYTPFPIDYVETEALRFYRKSFNEGRTPFQLLALRTLRFPFDLIGRVAHYFTDSDDNRPVVAATPWDLPVMQAASSVQCPLQQQ